MITRGSKKWSLADRAWRTENAKLRARVKELETEVKKLGAKDKRKDQVIERLKERLKELLQTVAELRRAAKRQAAPHSKGNPKKDRKPSGRKPGKDYGQKARRPIPDHVNKTVDVPLPDSCPHCSGKLVEDQIVEQYQEDIPLIRTFVTRFLVHIGHCLSCKARVQPRHKDQTSDALGAASSQLGPNVVTLLTYLKKSVGVSERKICKLFSYIGLSLSPGGVSQAVEKAGRRCLPTYKALVLAVRRADVVSPDETGWRVLAMSAWLWVFVGQDTLSDGSQVRFAVFFIASGRGYKEASAILGVAFCGVLERDGWASYRSFKEASHQSCLAHFMRRLRGMIADAKGGEARVPHALMDIFKDALKLRDARDKGELLPGALEEGVSSLEGRVEGLLSGLHSGRVTHPPNVTLLKHLENEQDHLFTFLENPEVAATNYKSEQALRGPIVNRKSWGGNFSWDGAVTQEVISSVFQTAALQGKDPIEILVPLLKNPEPALADLVIPRIEENEWESIPHPLELVPTARSP